MHVIMSWCLLHCLAYAYIYKTATKLQIIDNRIIMKMPRRPKVVPKKRTDWCIYLFFLLRQKKNIKKCTSWYVFLYNFQSPYVRVENLTKIFIYFFGLDHQYYTYSWFNITNYTIWKLDDKHNTSNYVPNTIEQSNMNVQL